MARRGAYKSEKRKKEVMRQKKQEQKRIKRLGKGPDSEGTVELPEGSEGTVEVSEGEVSEGTEEGGPEAAAE